MSRLATDGVALAVSNDQVWLELTAKSGNGRVVRVWQDACYGLELTRLVSEWDKVFQRLCLGPGCRTDDLNSDFA